ncbi:MAG TPA: MauE/DoxX family redox-associated membrane protein [Chitinophagaceae bacterium]|nr:MauE/DoxX family redox-associated membrane protein [Chitinophagaceae bacterium]
MKRRTVVEFISSLLVLLFVYTAVSKLLDYQTFKLQLSKSPFITDFASVTAWSLPAGELLVAAALMFGRTRLLGLYASLFLMTMFTAYIYAMLNYSYDLPCSCGGVLAKMSWTQHLWFNGGFVVLSIVGIVLHVMKSKEAAKEVEMPKVVYAAMQ